MKNIKILIVDDNSFVLDLLRQVLVNSGYSQIINASNGEEALAVLNKNKVDLVISDVQMPHMNGLELLKKIRCGYNRIKNNLPFIIVTNFSNTDVLGTAMALDVNGFLVKPFKSISIEKKILSATKEEFIIEPGFEYSHIITNLKSIENGNETTLTKVRQEDIAKESSDDNVKLRGIPVNILNIKEGMVLSMPVIGKDGSLLATEGKVLTKNLVNRLKEIREHVLHEKVWIET